MASFNKVILIGNMVGDPELKQTQGGTSVTTFNLAVNRRFTKGEEKACDFITVVAWRQTAEFITRYFKKGEPILIVGQIQTRTWTDKDGVKRYATEVVAEEASFVANKSEVNSSNAVTPSADGAQLGFGAINNPQYEELNSDADLPF